MELIALGIIFFVTSMISVATGSTSLITVPAMLQFGIEPRSAIATNMFALTLMSFGGTLSFRGTDSIDKSRLLFLALLTLAGSILGALLLIAVPSRNVPVIISIFMIAAVLFSIPRRTTSDTLSKHSRVTVVAGYVATFVLGAYGGFFSGGYVTMLTAAFVALFGMTFLQAVATTKLVNVFSSSVATIIFMWRGLVDYRLGILLGVIMFLGAYLGGRLSIKIGDLWLRRIFFAAVIALALKILLFDFLGQN